MKCRRAGEPALRLLRRELEGGGGGGGGGGDAGDAGGGEANVVMEGDDGEPQAGASCPCRVDWVGEDFAGWDLF